MSEIINHKEKNVVKKLMESLSAGLYKITPPAQTFKEWKELIRHMVVYWKGLYFS